MADVAEQTAAPPAAADAASNELVTTSADGAEKVVITTNAEGKKVKKIIRKKRRPARPQVDPSTFKSEPPPQTGTIFNIWYNKWSGGDREDKYLSKHAAPSRCNIARDTGYTRADSVPGSYFCLFFARGLCPKGADCDYLHRLPTIHDMFNPNVDCFGRDKHADYRDDMGGVGSFMRQNRTLYVGRIHVTDDIEEIVARHFQEWGQIDRTRVLNTRGVAFVTYTNEANSQFAKEAMAHQALDHSEVLNVRWATVDPNPQAQKREAHRIEEQAAEAIRRALPADYVAEIEGRDPDSKKRRKIEGSFGLQGYDAPDDVWYAKEKAAQLEAAQNGGLLEAPEEQKLLEAAADQEEAVNQQQQYATKEDNDGIFSGSTLAMLKNSGVTFTSGKKEEDRPKGPLVGYGSDDSD
ncbi:cell cycle control protein [Diplodia corticola]|uniref:Pre-mRNA-splicing factor CWC2 n=1 Tax=Diplodia corticola TaxID=236234 RepID=A0A1J9QRM4_9PEZI|nr:cell cycle control protein [Diplodia corticola]OJD31598.1 cell cycle control protein [Diplodia corticola]